MENLNLTLKAKWFAMILNGEKKEEYREIKNHWKIRLTTYNAFKEYDTITFVNGYGKHRPTMVVECKGIGVGYAKPEWSDNFDDRCFVIKLGDILETKNIYK
jgi:hypothetical protein